jgi:hypothetical protein
MSVERRPFDRLSTEALSLATPLAVLTAASLLGSAMAPELLAHHPLVLIALAPRTVFMVAGAPHVGVLAFIAVGTVRLAAADPFHFAIGRRYLGHRLDRHRRLIGRIGLPVVAVHPTGPVLAAAGAAGMRPTSVAVADVLGTVVQLAALHEIGRAVSLPGGPAMTLVVAGAGAVVGGAAALRLLVRRRWRVQPARPTPAGAPAVDGHGRPAAPRTARPLRTHTERRRVPPSPRIPSTTGSSGGTAPAPLLPVAASASA